MITGFRESPQDILLREFAALDDMNDLYNKIFAPEKRTGGGILNSSRISDTSTSALPNNLHNYPKTITVIQAERTQWTTRTADYSL